MYNLGKTLRHTISGQRRLRINLSTITDNLIEFLMEHHRPILFEQNVFRSLMFVVLVKSYVASLHHCIRKSYIELLSSPRNYSKLYVEIIYLYVKQTVKVTRCITLLFNTFRRYCSNCTLYTSISYGCIL